jgi:hypothetical protein
MAPRIIWDLEDDPDGNFFHIVTERHGITAEEVDEVLSNPRNPTIHRRESGNPITFGWTEQGQYIAVVWEHILDDPRTVKPITAYPTNPPRRKGKKKHGR